MRIFRVAAVYRVADGAGLRAGHAPHQFAAGYASKTPEEKEQEAARQKAYKDSLRKIPDAKVSSDPWGNVRSAATPKTPARRRRSRAPRPDRQHAN